VPEAGIEPARPYERGILSPGPKSSGLRLALYFPVRNPFILCQIYLNVFR
jgi:hypothetical protein